MQIFLVHELTILCLQILKLLSGKVVIGHAVHNDFKVLGYSHPAALTRDTSRIPLLNSKAGIPVHECASLKRLTKAIFNRDIQVGGIQPCRSQFALCLCGTVRMFLLSN